MHKARLESKPVRLPKRGGISPMASVAHRMTPQSASSRFQMESVFFCGPRGFCSIRMMAITMIENPTPKLTNTVPPTISLRTRMGGNGRSANARIANKFIRPVGGAIITQKPRTASQRFGCFMMQYWARWNRATKTSQQSLRLSCRLRLLLVSRPEDQIHGNHCQWDREIRIGETPLAEVQ